MRRMTGLAAIILGATFVVPTTAAHADGASLFSQVQREGFTLDELRTPNMHSGTTGNHKGHGDFDGDGVDDVVVSAQALSGTPFETEAVDGLVAVTYSTTPYIDYFAPPSQDPAISGNGLGDSIAAGDFNNDGFDDLAVGYSWEGLPGASLQDGGFLAGAVWVIPGSPSGLNLASAQHFNQNSPGVPGASEEGDAFGTALAVGDLNADGFDDLAVGVPGEALGTVKQAGSVDVFYGSGAGLKNTSVQEFDQNSPGVPGTSEENDMFGYSLAIAHVTSKTYADLVITAPGEVANLQWSGLTTVLKGSASGVTTSGATDASGWSKIRETTSVFPFWSGKTVTAVDTNGDGYAEVLVGSPDAQVTEVAGAAGAVLDFAGGTHGISDNAVKVFTQNTTDVPGTAEDMDFFAAALASGDVNGDGYGDLVVGAPFEGIGSATAAGGIWIIYGSTGGLTGTGARSYNQDSPGVSGVAETYDRFGSAVSVANLNGSGALDVLASSPNEQFASTDTSYGTVQLFSGGSSGLAPTSQLSALAYASVGTSLSEFGGEVANGDSYEAKRFISP